MEKIVFTGGHAGSTAYATIEALKQKRRLDIHFIGSKTSIEGKKSKTFAQVGLSQLDVKVHSISAGRLQKNLSFWSFLSLIKIPFGFFSAFWHLVTIKPKLVVSFGGYAAFPVVISAWMLGIPVILHEQTSVAGRANLASARFAVIIALARQSSLKYYSTRKTEITGNPIPSNIKTPTTLNKIHDPPRLVVTGGISGSTAINNVVEKTLSRLTKKYEIIHQTGDIDFEKFNNIKRQLGLTDRKYRVVGALDPSQWEAAVDWADIFVSRSGANFTYQLMVLKKPALLIPIPNSHLNEQAINARLASEFGIAKVVEQKQLTPETLCEGLDELLRSWPAKRIKLEDSKSPDIGASGRFADLILRYI